MYVGWGLCVCGVGAVCMWGGAGDRGRMGTSQGTGSSYVLTIPFVGGKQTPLPLSCFFCERHECIYCFLVCKKRPINVIIRIEIHVSN